MTQSTRFLKHLKVHRHIIRIVVLFILILLVVSISYAQSFRLYEEILIESISSNDSELVNRGIKDGLYLLQETDSAIIWAAILDRLKTEDYQDYILTEMVEVSEQSAATYHLPDNVIAQLKLLIQGNRLSAATSCATLLIRMNVPEINSYLLEMIWDATTNPVLSVHIINELGSTQHDLYLEADIEIVQNFVSYCLLQNSIPTLLVLIEHLKMIGHPCGLTALNRLTASEFNQIQQKALDAIDYIKSQNDIVDWSSYSNCQHCALSHRLTSEIWNTLSDCAAPPEPKEAEINTIDTIEENEIDLTDYFYYG